MRSDFQALLEAVTGSHADQALKPEERAAIAASAARHGGGSLEGAAVPPALAHFVETVALHAYDVTDEDVAALLAGGLSEDHVFEAAVTGAVGAAWARLEAGLKAVEGK
jgi:hypothetical protein